MSDVSGDDRPRVAYLPLMRHAWAHILDPSNRSRRSEIFAAIIILPIVANVSAGFVGIFISFVMDWNWPRQVDDRAWGDLLYGILALMPLPALVGRRLHDIGKPAWLAVPVIPLVALAFYRMFRDIQDGPYEIYSLTSLWPPLGYIIPIISLAYIVAMLVPGTPGGNAYGPDPRL